MNDESVTGETIGGMGVLRDRSHSLLNDQSIEAWIAENDPDGVEKLARAIRVGVITGARARFASEYLGRKVAAAQAVQAEREASRSERATVASELQARSARRANWLSAASLAVSVVALMIATLAYFRPLL